jgi:hypothetical protein
VNGVRVMELLKELKKKKFPVWLTIPNVHCKVFEDNSDALEMATVHKLRPRTKHLNVKLHHFRDYVTRKEISIHPIDTSMQLANYLTKAVNLVTLSRLSSVSNGMVTIISVRESVIISGSKWSSQEGGSRTQGSALLKYQLAILQPSIPKGSMAL